MSIEPNISSIINNIRNIQGDEEQVNNDMMIEYQQSNPENPSARTSGDDCNGPMLNATSTKVKWSMLEPGLQSYIFGHLIRELQYPSRVAQTLGLQQHEIENSMHILNMQMRHPLSCDQLYAYCISLTEDSNEYVDPEILRQYMQYFEFASNFDVASEKQKLFAYQYLRQRGVRGSFVNALVDCQDDTEDESNQEVVLLDRSYDGNSIRNLVQSPYFPPNIRAELLAKHSSCLTATEAWATVSSRANDVSLIDDKGSEPFILRGKSWSPYMVRSLMSIRRQFLKSDSRSNRGPRDDIDVHILQLIIANMSQKQLLRSKLSKLHVSDQERKIMLKAATKRQQSRLITSFRRSIVRQFRADFIGELPLNSDTLLGLVNAEYNSEDDSSSDSNSASGPDVEQEQVQQSDATVTSGGRSISVESFHTAHDMSEQLDNVRISPIRSPPRPDYSPINSDDEMEEVGFVAPSTVAPILPFDFPAAVLHKRFTPWKSDRRSISSHEGTANGQTIPTTLPTATSFIAQQVPFVTTNSYPPILAGIEDAALLLLSPIKSATESGGKEDQSEPPKLKLKPFVQSEVAESQSPKVQGNLASSLSIEMTAPDQKASRTPRTDKGRKRGPYNTKKKQQAAEEAAKSGETS